VTMREHSTLDHFTNTYSQRELIICSSDRLDRLYVRMSLIFIGSSFFGICVKHWQVPSPSLAVNALGLRLVVTLSNCSDFWQLHPWKTRDNHKTLCSVFLPAINAIVVE
jgi:hypothetical protein